MNKNNNNSDKTSCIFCKIIKKEVPAYVINEDKDNIAFLDINPVAKGHALVITKEHYDNFLEMDTKKINSLFTIVNILGKRIKNIMGSDGINIGTNIGKAAGQIIFHIHIHIIPRKYNDKIDFSNRLSLTEEIFRKIQNKLSLLEEK